MKRKVRELFKQSYRMKQTGRRVCMRRLLFHALKCPLVSWRRARGSLLSLLSFSGPQEYVLQVSLLRPFLHRYAWFAYLNIFHAGEMGSPDWVGVLSCNDLLGCFLISPIFDQKTKKTLVPKGMSICSDQLPKQASTVPRQPSSPYPMVFAHLELSLIPGWSKREECLCVAVCPIPCFVSLNFCIENALTHPVMCEILVFFFLGK